MAKGRRQRRGLVGVEFHETEIRVVEVRFAGGKPIILAAGSAQMPPNAITEGELVRADAVAFALRRLLDSLGVSSVDTVMGIPMGGFTTRALNLPPTPPDEQAMLIEGEVRHFDILRTADGAYDYFSLATGETGNETSIVLMASEGHITSSLRSVAERAGLEVVALEPISIAMLRAAAASPVSAPEGLYLSIGENASEASIIRNGQLWLYRRIDIGTQALFSAANAPMDRVDHTITAEEAAIMAKSRERELRKGPADTLGLEVRRTMEFYAREFSGASPVSVIHLMLNDTILEPVEAFLRDATSSEVQIVKPGGFVAQSDAANLELSGDLSYRYCGAYGLVLHKAEGTTSFIPSLDLYVRERSLAAMEVERKTLAGSLVAAIVAIVAGIGGTLYFGQRASIEEHRARDLEDQMKNLKSQQQRTLKSDEETISQISYLMSQGVPAITYMDGLAASLESGVGLNEVLFQDEANINIGGEASNEQAMLLTVQHINQSGLGYASITSYERIKKNSNDPSIKFTLKMTRPVTPGQAGGKP